jgi:hypothetical protein
VITPTAIAHVPTAATTSKKRLSEKKDLMYPIFGHALPKRKQ